MPFPTNVFQGYKSAMLPPNLTLLWFMTSKTAFLAVCNLIAIFLGRKRRRYCVDDMTFCIRSLSSPTPMNSQLTPRLAVFVGEVAGTFDATRATTARCVPWPTTSCFHCSPTWKYSKWKGLDHHQHHHEPFYTGPLVLSSKSKAVVWLTHMDS